MTNILESPSHQKDEVDLTRRRRKADHRLAPRTRCSDGLTNGPSNQNFYFELSNARSQNSEDVREFSRPSGQYSVLNEEEQTSYRASHVSFLQTPYFLEVEQRKAACLKKGLHTSLEESGCLPSCEACGCSVKDCALVYASRQEVVVIYVSLSDTFQLRVPIDECPR